MNFFVISNFKGAVPPIVVYKW